MAGKELSVFDIRELIRRLKLGQKERAVAREMGIHRDTVKGYRHLAEKNGWLEGADIPDLITIDQARKEGSPEPAPQEVSTVLSYQPVVEALLEKPDMTVTVIHQRLVERGFSGSYASVYRFVTKIRKKTDPEGFCRIEVDPGAEAQVDFGFIGKVFDPVKGKERNAWVFVMTLSHSRHIYAEVVFDQSSWTWLRLHEWAFSFFGGVPAKIVLDNLKAAIVKAAAHDPLVQRSYRDLAEHYGFIIDPNRPRTPRHKGKVERNIRYIKQNFLPGRVFRDLANANEQLTRWNHEVAGQRIHGTTGWRPLERFETVERSCLKPLPVHPWEPSVWKEATLHSDCYLHVEKSFYSAPFRLIDQELTVQVASQQVRIFHGLNLVATHERALVPRSRKFNPDHFPPEKIKLLQATPQWCLKQAERIGPSTLEWMKRFLSDPVMERVRSGLAALKLAEKYTPQRLEMACRRSLDFDEVQFNTLKRILVRGLDQQSWRHLLSPGPAAPVIPLRYVRKPGHYFGNGQKQGVHR